MRSILKQLELPARKRKPLTDEQRAARRAALAAWKKANPEKQKEYVRNSARRRRARLNLTAANDNTPQ